jgi:hypothetical protein
VASIGQRSASAALLAVMLARWCWQTHWRQQRRLQALHHHSCLHGEFLLGSYAAPYGASTHGATVPAHLVFIRSIKFLGVLH